MPHAAHTAPVITKSGDIIASRAPARERWSWSLYDFSNTIFSMNITTLFFAVWLVDDLHATNKMVAIGTVVSSALVFLSIPLFGAISDASQRRKPWVVWFTLIAVTMTIAIGVVGQKVVPLIGESVLDPSIASYTLGGTAAVAILTSYIIANYAYQGSLPFYNAMMSELVPPPEQGRLSGVGTALGYVGAIVGVLAVTPFFNGTVPPSIVVPPDIMAFLRSAIPFTEHAGRVSTFTPTAILFLVFSLPLFIFCKDHNVPSEKKKIPWKQGFRDVAHTIEDAKQYPGTIRFILASFLYQDAIGTIIANMALYAVMAMNFEKGLEATLFVALTVPAVIGSYLIGKLVDRIGPKKSLMFVIGCWIVLLIAMVLVPNRTSFWVVGGAIGLIFGGVPTAERPMLLTLIPDVKASRFFSLMVLSSRAAAIVGPLIWAFTVDGLIPSYGTGFAYRAGIVTVTLGMVGALAILWGVPDKWRPRAAE